MPHSYVTFLVEQVGLTITLVSMLVDYVSPVVVCGCPLHGLSQTQPVDLNHSITQTVIL